MSVETDMQAAEYVLGTLSAEERRAFETLLKSDASARRALEVWQQRLAPLSAAIGEVEPPAGVWQTIEQALSTSSEAAPDILRLRRSRDRWRMATVLVSALAAGTRCLRHRPYSGGPARAARQLRRGDQSQR